jgi:cell division protein FtsI (penicillin-binding protein 3)
MRGQAAGHADAEWIEARRIMIVALGLGLVFLGIAAQLVRLALPLRADVRTNVAEPLSQSFARPDIVDRRGQLIATDIAAPSLYADPALIVDLDEMVEKLVATLPGLNEQDLRRSLADRQKRFQWIKRGLTPQQAQAVHDLGLPALGFRQEPKRVYPAEDLIGHVLGTVNVDNHGIAGIERYIDETMGIDMVSGAAPSSLRPVRLSLDLGVQHAVADELAAAMKRYSAPAAAGLVMDIMTGEIVAALSLPSVDPNHPAEAIDPERPDRLQTSVWELGSIFKMLTIAMALEDGATLDKVYPTTRPLEIGKYTIKDLHPQPAPLSIRDIFIHSSNVGAGLMGLEAGAERQKAFLSGLGLLEPLRTESGPVALPLVPQHWERIETVTIAYGHGLAVAPLQFAAVAAALLNGGHAVVPTYLAGARKRPEGGRLITAGTSRALREIMRLNVTSPHGTGRRADVAGFDVGGKTGTAEMAGVGGYRRKSVISSFVAALPMPTPRYLTMVSLFEPKGTAETKGGITAGLNAAPVTGRIIERIAPILGLMPRRLQVGPTRTGFDAAGDAK